MAEARPMVVARSHGGDLVVPEDLEPGAAPPADFVLVANCCFVPPVLQISSSQKLTVLAFTSIVSITCHAAQKRGHPYAGQIEQMVYLSSLRLAPEVTYRRFLKAMDALTEEAALQYFRDVGEVAPKLIPLLEALGLGLASAQLGVAAEIPPQVYAIACQLFGEEDAIFIMQMAVDAIGEEGGPANEDVKAQIRGALARRRGLVVKDLTAGGFHNLQNLALPLLKALLPEALKLAERARSLELGVPTHLRIYDMGERMGPKLLRPMRECMERMEGVYRVCKVLMNQSEVEGKPCQRKGLKQLLGVMDGVFSILMLLCPCDAAMLPQPGDLLTRLHLYKVDEAGVAASKEEAARIERKLHTLTCNKLCLRIKADGIVMDIGNLRASEEETAKLQCVVRQLLGRFGALESNVADLQEQPDTTAADLEKLSGEMVALQYTLASISVSLRQHSEEMAAAEPVGVAAAPNPGMTALVERLEPLALGTQAVPPASKRAPTAPAAPHVSAAVPPASAAAPPAAAEAPSAAAPAPAAPNVLTAAARPASALRDGSNTCANKATKGGTANAADRRAHAKAAKPAMKTASKIPAGPAAAAPAAAAEAQRAMEATHKLVINYTDVETVELLEYDLIRPYYVVINGLLVRNRLPIYVLYEDTKYLMEELLQKIAAHSKLQGKEEIQIITERYNRFTVNPARAYEECIRALLAPPTCLGEHLQMLYDDSCKYFGEDTESASEYLSIAYTQQPKLARRSALPYRKWSFKKLLPPTPMGFLAAGAPLLTAALSGSNEILQRGQDLGLTIPGLKSAQTAFEYDSEYCSAISFCSASMLKTYEFLSLCAKPDTSQVLGFDGSAPVVREGVAHLERCYKHVHTFLRGISHMAVLAVPGPHLEALCHQEELLYGKASNFQREAQCTDSERHVCVNAAKMREAHHRAVMLDCSFLDLRGMVERACASGTSINFQVFAEDMEQENRFIKTLGETDDGM
ncbi:hypothetical protein C2E21_7236 [Chlorella sorokiniana]|uniref:Uncharacterized protein n=1 Tax=Chlorella sorokiniana TaxID=3076 RepID=A0A2P6TI76_CHLSO|nr:hypothetical protein C2E21_7236 [Chlorella sorokiniana]|eukprot:PRW33993.1 hypothetical protein C2E21_7236 [Chlorella sorokiniana]